MLAGVSHDLRTPLTRVRLQLAMLADAHPDSREEITESEQDLQLMEHMIDEYMAFARGQGGEAPVSTDLAEIIEDVAGDAQRKGSPITLEVERPLVVALRPNAIRRCLTNLVENAMHHGAQVAISATRRDDVVSVAVEGRRAGHPGGASAKRCSSPSSASTARATRAPAAPVSASRSRATSPAGTAATSA